MSAPEASLQIVSTTVTERESSLLWRVEWEDRSGGDGVTSLFGESTYQRQIAPRYVTCGRWRTSTPSKTDRFN
jgi:hypothetical protein